MFTTKVMSHITLGGSSGLQNNSHVCLRFGTGQGLIELGDKDPPSFHGNVPTTYLAIYGLYPARPAACLSLFVLVRYQ